MEYNWKYAKIRSSSAFKVWKNWASYHKLRFINYLRDDYSNELRLFACWCIEEIIGRDDLEKDKNSALYIAKKVARKKMRLERLLEIQGRYRTPYDYDNLMKNNYADSCKGPDQQNITWLRIMHRACHKDAYESTRYILSFLEDYRAQPMFNKLRESEISEEKMNKINDKNQNGLEEIFCNELENRFNHIFNAEELDIYVGPNVISHHLNIGPFECLQGETLQRKVLWTYGAWAFCIDNGIIK